MSDLAERLGFPGDARLLIVSCDGLGFTHACNQGVYQALRDGVGTSSSIMVPCPWAREAASSHRGEDVGVQLTLTASHELYRWAPLTQAPSLLDGDGGFPRTSLDVWEHADLDEVRRECRAQIERAILWGFDVTHLAGQIVTMSMRPEFFGLYLELAVEYRLPLRLPEPAAQRSAGFPFRDLAAAEGVLFPDNLVSGPRLGSRAEIRRVIEDLPSGVTEICLHPGVDAPELRAIDDAWSGRVDDLDVACDPETRILLERAGVRTIGYRELRGAQRA